MKSVTGVITTYKRDAEVVEKAIKSMLSQTYPLKEIIVVDDNFDDSEFCAPLKEMCSKYDIVKYIKQDGNKGACAARNLGIENATGEFVAFLDDDDKWLPEKIEKQINIFNNVTENVGIVYCGGVIKNLNTNEEKDYYNIKKIKDDLKFEDFLAFDYVGSTSNPLIQKKVFDDVGGFWEEQPARQDYEMWIRISQKYKIIGIPYKLFIHTIHNGEQISRSSKRAYIGYKNIYKRYIQFYKKNIKAEDSILSAIRGNYHGFSFEYLLFFIRACWVKLRLKMKREKK